jgi:hypothetical protein
MVRAGPNGGIAPLAVKIHGDDRPRAGSLEEHRDQQAHDALPDDERCLVEPRMPVEDHGHSGLEIRGEDASLGRDTGRQPQREVRRHDELGLVRMVSEHEVVDLRLRDIGARLGHGADDRVPELDRELEVALHGRQVRGEIGRCEPAVDEELAAGAEPRYERPHPNVLGSDGRAGLGPDFDRPGSGKPDRLRHAPPPTDPSPRRR